MQSMRSFNTDMTDSLLTKEQIQPPDYWLKNDFIAEHDAHAFFTQLLTQLPWRQDKIKMFGKEVKIPRLQVFMGDSGVEYTYSNLTLNAHPWHPAVLEIRNRIQALTGSTFNAALLNYYRNGQDSMGWHQDNEPELGDAPIIASVSLGASRPFMLRHLTDKQRKEQLILNNGSLLWMGPKLQAQWQHSLPKRPTSQSARINLTFRQVLTQKT